jgi:hypothetical protein
MGPEQAATVTMVPPSVTSGWDWKNAEVDGVVLDPKYNTQKTRKGYVKITPPPTENT